MTDDRLAVARWLASGSADEALAAAAAAVAARPHDPLAAGAALRRSEPGLGASRVAAVLEQATLRAEARSRHGLPDTWLLTRDGTEQATRPEVADRRARLLVDCGARRVLDLTAGLGADTAAFTRAGLEVIAVERDPATAVLLGHNCPGVRIVTGDCRDVLPALLPELAPEDVVFADPARRDPLGPRRDGRARPERDPERWSPPWSQIAAIPHPRIVAKVAPAFEPPPAWCAEWTSVERSLVECTVYSWAAFTAARRAVVMTRDHVTLVSDVGAECATAGQVQAWLHEPDPAVVRAGVTGTLCAEEPGLHAVDRDSSWLTSDRHSDSLALRSHLVIAPLEGSARQQRRQLAELGIDRLTVKSRDTGTSPASVLRELDVREGNHHVLVMTRRGGHQVRFVCEPARSA